MLTPTQIRRSPATHGWRHLDRERKREIIAAIVSGKPTIGPSHIELNITDRCNIACYFCSQQDIRTSEQICYERLVQILNELVPRGLKSVRMSGGGNRSSIPTSLAFSSTSTAARSSSTT